MPGMDWKLPNFEWTDESVDQVAALMLQGKSASQIGAIMGLSRNSIIGKIHRHERLRYAPWDSAKARKPVVPKRENPAPKLVILPMRPKMQELVQEPYRRKDGMIGPGIALLPLGRFQCQYAVNDAARDELHLFCAAPIDRSAKATRAKYCEAHGAIVFSLPRERKAA